ncbi:hypothetical protein A0H81_05144 [Grifola frondosa]|uniref:Uncharacterized protein n=1 Tax=Grifola frondosa TaxID=5627 RepID=A0A1C7ME35_GRIFR|nr:hypothetical protein A0H81_05144 [Grifola frondosa]
MLTPSPRASNRGLLSFDVDVACTRHICRFVKVSTVGRLHVFINTTTTPPMGPRVDSMETTASSSSAPASYLLGPLVVAVVFNSFLYGINTVLYFQYLSRHRDRWAIKLLVHWVFLADSVISALTINMLWDYTVTNFTNTSILTSATWSYAITPLLTVSNPVQHFFAWRVYRFTRHPSVFFGLSSLSLASGALGIASSIAALTHSRWVLSRTNWCLLTYCRASNFKPFLPLGYTWLALMVACELSLTMKLSYHLIKQKTGFKKMDTVINRLIRSSVETSSLSTLFCTLNFRTNLREEMQSSAPQFLIQSDGFADQPFRAAPTEVAIAVESNVHISRDSCAFNVRKSLKG